MMSMIYSGEVYTELRPPCTQSQGSRAGPQRTCIQANSGTQGTCGLEKPLMQEGGAWSQTCRMKDAPVLGTASLWVSLELQ